jgi:hypothetical protein
MTATEEFLKKHGSEWAKIVRSAAMNDALLLLNVEKLKSVTNLQAKEIHEHGPEILADLVGHLKHENDLLTLHEHRTFEMTELAEHETYGEDVPSAIPEKARKGKK